MKIWGYEALNQWWFYPRKGRAMAMGRNVSSQHSEIVQVFEFVVRDGTQAEMVARAASREFDTRTVIGAFRRGKTIKGWVEACN